MADEHDEKNNADDDDTHAQQAEDPQILGHLINHHLNHFRLRHAGVADLAASSFRRSQVALTWIKRGRAPCLGNRFSKGRSDILDQSQGKRGRPGLSKEGVAELSAAVIAPSVRVNSSKEIGNVTNEISPDPASPARDTVPFEQPASPPSTAGTSLVPSPGKLPEVTEHPAASSKRSRWKITAFATLCVLAAAGGGAYWWWTHQQGLPAGIVSSNGRVEAEEIDIETKFAGRVAQLLVNEGDSVTAGQVVARMDTRDLEASLAKANATVQQAQHSLDEARANVVQQQTQVTFAQQQFDRTNALVQRGYATIETLDQRRQALNAATATLNASNDRVGEADRALAAATHDVSLYEVNIADNSLVAPTDGRIQYRISNVGEVLAAGGKIFTLIDVSNVYMDVYLPTADAGRARVGSQARIVLDAYPTFAVPAHVSFIATQAQFTPKAVETKSERDKLMFRVKVRVDDDFLRAHKQEVRTGLPGIAYVKVDPQVAWPAALQGPAVP
ncbi:hypothetical protein LMIY3S_01889 [Labrys miyagiensis]